MKSIIAVTLFLVTCSLSGFGQSDSRAGLLKELETKRAELAKLETQFLSPSDEDRAAFATLLNQPNTGLIRLLPRESFGEVPNQPSKLKIRGGGAYYYFVRLTHESGY